MAHPKTLTADIIETAPRQGGGPGMLRDDELSGAATRALAASLGLTQFGVNHVTLQPGAWSALRHWHETEDELVYVLFGEVTLVDENGPRRLQPGHFAAFPAGAANAHHLQNRSHEPAAFLAIGTRRVGEETIHYPDDPQLGTRIVTRGPDGVRIQTDR